MGAGVPAGLAGQALPVIQGRLEGLPYKVRPMGRTPPVYGKA